MFVHMSFVGLDYSIQYAAFMCSFDGPTSQVRKCSFRRAFVYVYQVRMWTPKKGYFFCIFLLKALCLVSTQCLLSSAIFQPHMMTTL